MPTDEPGSKTRLTAATFAVASALTALTAAAPSPATAENCPAGPSMRAHQLEAVRQKVAQGQALSTEDLKVVAASFTRTAPTQATLCCPSWE